MCGESNYESNGSFGNENRVRTRKLGPKRRQRKICQSDSRVVFLGENEQGNVAATPLGIARMTCDIAKMAMSQA